MLAWLVNTVLPASPVATPEPASATHANGTARATGFQFIHPFD
jgi:hypothetical protein